MSRGPGRWQRVVLELVAARTTESGEPGWVTLEEVVGAINVDPTDPWVTPSNAYEGAEVHVLVSGARARGDNTPVPVSVAPGVQMDTRCNAYRSQREAARRAIRTLAHAGQVDARCIAVRHADGRWHFHYAARRPPGIDVLRAESVARYRLDLRRPYPNRADIEAAALELRSLGVDPEAAR